MLWDRGTWMPKEDPASGYRKGRLKFELEGEKLHGGWTLVRSRGGKYGGDKAWLLIKEHDEFARARRGGAHRRGASPTASRPAAASRRSRTIADRVWHSNKSVADEREERRGAKQRRSRALRRSPSTSKARVEARACPTFVEAAARHAGEGSARGRRLAARDQVDGYRMLCRIDDGEARDVSRATARTGPATSPPIARAARAAAGRSRRGSTAKSSCWRRTGARASRRCRTRSSARRSATLHLLRLRPAVPRRLRPARRAARRAQARCSKRCSQSAPATLRYSEHVAGPGEAFFAAGVQARARRHHLQAGAVGLSARAAAATGSSKCSTAPGDGDRRLHRPEGSAQRLRRAAARRLRAGRQAALCRQGRHRLQRSDARDRCTSGCKRSRRRSPPFSNPPRGAEARARTG